MSMSRAERNELDDMKKRVGDLETMVGLLTARDLPDEIGIDHAEHVAAFPKKRGRPPKVNSLG